MTIGRPRIKGDKSVTVSLRGDSRYKEAIRRVAVKHGVKVADITRQALDRVYGESIRDELALLRPLSEQNCVS